MINKIAIATGVLVLLLVLGLFVRRRLKRRVKQDVFKRKWDDIQKLCAERKTWPVAVVRADKLLLEALKKRGHKGKTTGERLVAAQRTLSDNDGVWFGHNLAKKITGRSVKRLRESDVKRSLVGIRQALRDLEVLNGDK